MAPTVNAWEAAQHTTSQRKRFSREQCDRTGGVVHANPRPVGPARQLWIHLAEPPSTRERVWSRQR